MSPARLILISGSFALVAFVTGCGKHHDDHDGHDHEGHGEHGEAGEGAGASFKEGRGLQLPPEVVAALGVRTVEVEERSLARTLSLTAQVFSTGPSPRALSLVSPAQAAGLKPGLKTTGGAELVAISRTAEKATGQVELIFSLPDALSASDLGDTFTLSLTLAADSPALTVPRSALLDTATGTFVYVVNGPAYLRTPVTVGASDADLIEITDGLYAGDTVVAAPVNQLWLSELRLTKGGGHSH
jgi:hypothetical protein